MENLSEDDFRPHQKCSSVTSIGMIDPVGPTPDSSDSLILCKKNPSPPPPSVDSSPAPNQIATSFAPQRQSDEPPQQQPLFDHKMASNEDLNFINKVQFDRDRYFQLHFPVSKPENELIEEALQHFERKSVARASVSTQLGKLKRLTQTHEANTVQPTKTDCRLQGPHDRSETELIRGGSHESGPLSDKNMLENNCGRGMSSVGDKDQSLRRTTARLMTCFDKKTSTPNPTGGQTNRRLDTKASSNLEGQVPGRPSVQVGKVVREMSSAHTQGSPLKSSHSRLLNQGTRLGDFLGQLPHSSREESSLLIDESRRPKLDSSGTTERNTVVPDATSTVSNGRPVGLLTRQGTVTNRGHLGADCGSGRVPKATLSKTNGSLLWPSKSRRLSGREETVSRTKENQPDNSFKQDLSVTDHFGNHSIETKLDQLESSQNTHNFTFHDGSHLNKVHSNVQHTQSDCQCQHILRQLNVLDLPLTHEVLRKLADKLEELTRKFDSCSKLTDDLMRQNEDLRAQLDRRVQHANDFNSKTDRSAQGGQDGAEGSQSVSFRRTLTAKALPNFQTRLCPAQVGLSQRSSNRRIEEVRQLIKGIDSSESCAVVSQWEQQVGRNGLSHTHTQLSFVRKTSKPIEPSETQVPSKNSFLRSKLSSFVQKPIESKGRAKGLF